ncbi:MAG: nucleotidyltransferase domain-containing protein [Bacteroidales bacterium]|jgi:predicted nucleotidyltransferase|nr:nucleotidyltransferase domain-containing protein [Bacteroidales bacterium]
MFQTNRAGTIIKNGGCIVLKDIIIVAIRFFQYYYLVMDGFEDRLDNIRDSILKHVPAKYIYLFGSYAYGKPTEKSDIDIYIVTPDDVDNFSEIYAKIMGDLGDKKIFFIDLSLNGESNFNMRKTKNRFEKTIFQKGKIIYEH